jgi:hypothetical protein
MPAKSPGETRRISSVVVDVAKCTSHTRCWFCDQEQITRAATIRAFSGTYGGSFPACDVHANKAISLALEPLTSKGINPETYIVRVYAVVGDGYGYPRPGPLLFTARRKALA